MNSTVSGILSALTDLRDYANRSLAGIDAGGVFKMYDSELELVDQTLQNVQTAYTFAMSARYNVTSQKNKSVELNDTAMGIDSGLNEAQSKSNQTERGIQEVTEFITYALALINQTKACYFMFHSFLQSHFLDLLTIHIFGSIICFSY